MASHLTFDAPKFPSTNKALFEQAQTEGYPNSLAFWRQDFYIAPQKQASDLGAAVASGEVNIEKMQLSSDRISLGQPIFVSALSFASRI